MHEQNSEFAGQSLTLSKQINIQSLKVNKKKRKKKYLTQETEDADGSAETDNTEVNDKT